MEPNPQTVNYAMYVLAGSAALTAAAAYVSLRWLPRKLAYYQSITEDARTRTREVIEDTRTLIKSFYSVLDRNLPPQESTLKKDEFRANLEQRLGPERAAKFLS